MKQPLKISTFKTEDEERAFWAKIDLADYFEAQDFKLSEPMILRLKERANERHVPYQSLIKQYIAEGLRT